MMLLVGFLLGAAVASLALRAAINSAIAECDKVQALMAELAEKHVMNVREMLLRGELRSLSVEWLTQEISQVTIECWDGFSATFQAANDKLPTQQDIEQALGTHR